MGRSVSTPFNAAAVAYTHIDTTDYDAQDDYDWMVEDFQQEVRRIFPSARGCSKPLGREDYASMENGHAYFGMSEYCGLIAYWIVPKDDSPLAESWCNKAAPKFEQAFGTMRRIGTASNGESFYERIRD